MSRLEADLAPFLGRHADDLCAPPNGPDLTGWETMPDDQIGPLDCSRLGVARYAIWSRETGNGETGSPIGYYEVVHPDGNRLSLLPPPQSEPDSGRYLLYSDLAQRFPGMPDVSVAYPAAPFYSDATVTVSPPGRLPLVSIAGLQGFDGPPGPDVYVYKRGSSGEKIHDMATRKLPFGTQIRVGLQIVGRALSIPIVDIFYGMASRGAVDMPDPAQNSRGVLLMRVFPLGEATCVSEYYHWRSVAPFISRAMVASAIMSGKSHPLMRALEQQHFSFTNS